MPRPETYPPSATLEPFIQTALRAFGERFGGAPRWMAAAPGRVNLIGEHTDHNDGFVLPMAIDRYTLVVAAPAREADAAPARLRIHSAALDETVDVPLTGSLGPGAPAPGWVNYVRGVVAGFVRRGLTPPSLDALVVSEVPLGGGLSSSAALEVATATLLEAATGTTLDARDKARLCRQAEHDFAGVPCGLMDQLASVLGGDGEALLIDCRSETVRRIPFAAAEICVLICNTNVKHALADGEYRRRRAECAEAARQLGLSSLRDASPEMVEAARQVMDPAPWRRARHVTSENARTLAAVERLEAGDFAAVGALMYQSHLSLRDDFEVSCMELDTLVDVAREIGAGGGVLGARMIGGGFGGCTITLVRRDSVAAVTATLSAEYLRRTGRTLDVFLSRPARGAHLIAPPLDPERHPHRRYNPLTGQWLLVSPHRAQRPWLGQREPQPAEQRPTFDPTCALCPGNRRAGGAVNPPYPGTFVFDNDFGALLPGDEAAPDGAGDGPDADPLLRAEAVRGTCRVICFSPRHDLTLAEMDRPSMSAVIETWVSQTAALGATYRSVQVFENKGAAMGCSNPHPHGQIWASSALPQEAEVEDRQQRAYLARHGSPLLIDYAARERSLAARTVCENPDWLALVPFWAIWPYETMIVPRRRVARLPDLTAQERAALAALLGVLLPAYDRLFDVSFPYSMGWHGAPFDGDQHDHWQLHGHVYPPLLRPGGVKKFMVGYEMLAEPQRDLTPEQAARRLRELTGAANVIG